MDVLSVSACVQAVTSAFCDGAALVRRIKEKQENVVGGELFHQQIDELSVSLDLGPPIVQGQYDSDLRKFGETYARGDNIAREQLKDVLITLQMAVLSNLTSVWMGSRPLDYQALQIASDDSRVNAVSCLIQWQQRLASAATAQQKSTNYQMGVNSRPMTPPLTAASSHSGRSSILAARPLTPDRTSDHLAGLQLARPVESGYGSPASPGPYVIQSTYAVQRGQGRAERELPYPLFAHSGPSVGRSDTVTALDMSFPLAIPPRASNRPPAIGPQYSSRRPSAADIYSQAFPSPVSAVGPENEHYDPSDFGQSGLPRSLDSPNVNYAALYNRPVQGARRAVSSGSRISEAHSDHSTLEPVSVLTSSDIHPYFRNEQQRQAPGRASSVASALPLHIPQRRPIVPPKNDTHPPNQQSPQTDRPASLSIPISPHPGHRISSTAASIISSSTTTRPTPTTPSTTTSTPISLTLTLPNENNSYLGFCKGAYKLQIGLPTKKAFSVESRPAGLYSTLQIWRCSKCSFEGPVSHRVALPGSGKKAGKAEKLFDPRVRVSQGGIAYRWAFLAKCHVTTKGVVDGVRDGSFGTFGCLFCAAEGAERGWTADNGAAGAARAVGSSGKGGKAVSNNTPMYGNVESFMQHLEMHRTVEGLPRVEMQERTRCIVGRVAEVTEEFDVNLPPLGA